MSEYVFIPETYGYEEVGVFPYQLDEYFGSGYLKVIVSSPDINPVNFWFSHCSKYPGDDRWEFSDGVFSPGKPREIFELGCKPHKVYSGLITSESFARELLCHLLGSAFNRSFSCGATRLDDRINGSLRDK